MKPALFALLFLVLIGSCRKRYEAPVPDLAWDVFESPTSAALPNAAGQKLEGIYSLSSNNNLLGAEAAAKWSYTANGTDTVFNLSFFCNTEASYLICEGRFQQDSTLLLNGYWRRLRGTETGRVRLTITKDMGARLLQNDPLFAGPIAVNGVYGNGEAVPDQSIQLQFLRPLYKGTPLQIVAHRGGGRTSDLLPASENSVEIIKMASRFGATGIEIDVRLTSDGVPVIYHDGTLNERLIQKNGLIGPIENYSYAQLSALVRLIKGERIPTLAEALNTVVYNTPLQFVWLDTKYDADMRLSRDYQAEYTQKATAIGRTLNIYIGIPDRDVLANFKKLPNYTGIPSINELTREELAETNSRIWAPRFTLGLQNAEVAEVQAGGRQAFVWTLDTPEDIQNFVANGQFNGILSNYPSAVAYNYYAKQ